MLHKFYLSEACHLVHIFIQTSYLLNIYKEIYKSVDVDY